MRQQKTDCPVVDTKRFHIIPHCKLNFSKKYHTHDTYYITLCLFRSYCNQIFDFKFGVMFILYERLSSNPFRSGWFCSAVKCIVVQLCLKLFVAKQLQDFAGINAIIFVGKWRLYLLGRAWERRGMLTIRSTPKWKNFRWIAHSLGLYIFAKIQSNE